MTARGTRRLRRPRRLHRRTLAGGLALACMVSACTEPTYRYTHRTKLPTDYENDWNVCRAINDAVPISILGLLLRPFQQPPMDRCLRTLGWRREWSGADAGVSGEPATFVYTTSCTLLRFGPDESRGIKTRLDPGHRFIEKSRRGKWVHVGDSELDGWVHARDVGPTDPKLPPCPPLQAPEEY